MKQYRILPVALCLMLAAGIVHSHGNVTPSPVDVEGLPAIDGWTEENPYRDLSSGERDTVIRRGEYAYHQNCANCHGLDAKAGGIAPDLRMLTPSVDDAYYVGRVRNGGRGMPAFGDVLQPEAVWAIRSWLETLHDQAMEERYGTP